jgi:CarD family transcriptional regulator
MKRVPTDQEVIPLAVAAPMTAAMVSAALKSTAAKVKPKDGDPFREGDAVVYPAHGVGRIDHVGVEEIAGYKLNLIRVSFAENRMTLRIPVAQARGAGLRKLATRQQLADALAKLKGRPRASRIMWAKRSQEYLAKINSGELVALAEVVRDLQASGDGSGSSFSQRNLFELALDRLAAECAAITNISKFEASEQLQNTLLEARTAAAQSERLPSNAAA